MPIMFSSGPTPEAAFDPSSVVFDPTYPSEDAELADSVEEALYETLKHLSADLTQLRPFKGWGACSDEYFPPRELTQLIEDIQFAISRGARGAALPPGSLWEGLSALLPYFRGAMETGFVVHAHIE